MTRSGLILAFAVLAGTGCYHATIDTGRPPAPETIEKNWAHGFVYGLVPPSVVETAQKCPNGVAKVETMQSFLNGLVYYLTWGLYSPMTIKVTCAARASADNTPALRASDVGASSSELIQQAADLSRKLDAPVLIEFN